MRTLVILPGWGGTKDTWQTFVDLAKFDFDVQVINLPCFGDEPCPSEVWGVEKYAEFVKSKVHKVHKVTILGHSFGGQIAAYFVAHNPEMVDKLILSGPAVFRPKMSSIKHLVYLLAKIGKIFFKLPHIGKYENQIKNIFYNLIHGKDYHESAGIKRDIFKKVIKEDLTTIIPMIKAPTLIIWGSKDQYLPVSDAYKMHKLIPNSKLEIIKDGTHGLHLTQPENLLKIIKQFLNDNAS